MEPNNYNVARVLYGRVNDPILNLRSVVWTHFIYLNWQDMAWTLCIIQANTTPKRFVPELLCPLNDEGVEMRQFTSTFKRFVTAIRKQKCNQGNAVGTVTRLWTRRPGVRISAEASAFLSLSLSLSLSLEYSGRLCVPSNLLLNRP